MNSIPKQNPSEKIILGLSGGVDSSVAALLLKSKGYTVETVFMKNWEEDDTYDYCHAATDYKDAVAVAEILNLKIYERNFSSEYWNNVFLHCLEEFRHGRTPNPDVLCNKEIKFKVFLEHALALGAEKIATGHYAQIKKENGTYRLYKALDSTKDQSYFLYTLNQFQLSRTFFPLGGLAKSEVRELARKAGLTTSDKKDSTGLCFIGERNFNEFLQGFFKKQPGDIRTLDNKRIGEHDGLVFYTLGQRKGLGIGGLQSNSSQPWYVVNKDLETNTLFVAQGNNHPSLLSDTTIVSDLHWISGKSPTLPFKCTAKTRYRQTDQPCLVSTHDHNNAIVVFDHKQRSITPGQSMVFYHNSECLGGGIIKGNHPKELVISQ